MTTFLLVNKLFCMLKIVWNICNFFLPLLRGWGCLCVVNWERTKEFKYVLIFFYGKILRWKLRHSPKHSKRFETMFIYIVLSDFLKSDPFLGFITPFYEWAKRTKFLLAVIYGSACRHSIGSKTFKKIGKCEIKMYDHFRTSWIV